MSDVPAISIVKRGCDKFPRFILAKADEYRNPVYWNGSDWTANEAEARIYANVSEACWVHHDILMESLQNRPVHRYVAPLYIEVFGEKPKLEDLRMWLERAVRIVVNTPKQSMALGQTRPWRFWCWMQKRRRGSEGTGRTFSVERCLRG